LVSIRPRPSNQIKKLDRPIHLSKHLGWMTSSTKIWAASSHPTSPFNQTHHKFFSYDGVILSFTFLILHYIDNLKSLRFQRSH
jgi:hypothetical protein